MAKVKVKPLIYTPPPRWYFWTAFGLALAINVTAVAVSQRREAPPVDLPPQPPQVIEAVLAPPEATPPPEDIPIPEPPPPPDIQPEFVEERTPPPRQPQNAQKFTPIKAPGPMSMSRAKALASYGYWGRGAYKARAFARDIDIGPGALIGVNFCAVFCGRGGGVRSSTNSG